mgnify:CR=1 FL=1
MADKDLINLLTPMADPILTKFNNVMQIGDLN